MRFIHKTRRAARLMGTAILFCGVACAWAQTDTSPTTPPIAAAVADSVSTYLGVTSQALTENNPLVNTSAIGLAALLAAKLWIVDTVDQQEPETRAERLKTLSALWGGVAVNNVAGLLGLAGPQALLVGIVGWFGAHRWESDVLEAERVHGVEAALAKAALETSVETAISPTPE